MDVGEPKGLNTPRESGVVDWARRQLQIATEIIDNPGGGLLFATQAMGQVRAALAEEDEERWRGLGTTLLEAEDAAVHRRFQLARELIAEAQKQLPEA